MLTMFNFLLDNKQTGSSQPVGVVRPETSEPGHIIIAFILGALISAIIALIIHEFKKK